MTPFYSTPERISALRKEAAEWIGTPFVPNGCVKKFGASCQSLVCMIYKNTGFLPQDFAIPSGPMGWHHKNSIIEDAVKLAGKWTEIMDGRPMAGDLLGFKMGTVVHHCGLLTEGDRFVHVFEKLRVKTMFSSLREPTYSTRLMKVWRPVAADGEKL